MGIIDYIEMKKRQRARQEAWDATKKVGLGLIVGSIVGCTAGILFAPQSGEKTRKDIQKKALEGKKLVELKGKEIYEDLKDKYKEFNERNLTDIGILEDDDDEDVEIKVEKKNNK